MTAGAAAIAPGTAPLARASTPVLRVAAAWGTTIVGVKLLQRGQSCVLGTDPGSLAPKPDELQAPDVPLRAVAGGWELDARGAVSGVLVLRGREENLISVSRSGAPVPVLPGDYGLVQYGLFSIFFQYTTAAPELKVPFSVEPLTALSIFSSFVFHVGLISLFIIVPPGKPFIPPPPELDPDLAARFNLSRPLEDMVQAATDKDNNAGGGTGIKDPGAKDPKKMGGGRKIVGNEGKAGMNSKDDHTELPGEIHPTTNYGGLSEALADTGTDIKKTLAQIQTVTEALGGLNSNNVVLGSGPGTGLHGTGGGGGGTGAGVMFGSGTMDTGWGPGTGGGFGSGAGGPGGRGSGGFGSGGTGGGTGGGNGTGNGSGNGPGEHGVQGGAGPGAAHGGLNPEQIRRVVIAHRGALQACYEIEAQKDPTLKGGVTISWTIDATGGVTSAGLAGSTIHNPRVEGCVLRQVRTWHFPSSDGVSQATFPFSFGIGR